MKRRRFLALTTLSVAALTFPSLHCTSKDDVLHVPRFLLELTDEKTVMEIGAAYLTQFPSETGETELTQLVLAGVNDSQSASSISEAIIRKIQLDFLNEDVVVTNGWVLSLTEARQAALFTLKSKENAR